MPQLGEEKRQQVAAKIAALNNEIPMLTLMDRKNINGKVRWTLNSFDNPCVAEIAKIYSGEILECEMYIYCEELLGDDVELDFSQLQILNKLLHSAIESLNQEGQESVLNKFLEKLSENGLPNSSVRSGFQRFKEQLSGKIFSGIYRDAPDVFPTELVSDRLRESEGERISEINYDVPDISLSIFLEKLLSTVKIKISKVSQAQGSEQMSDITQVLTPRNPLALGYHERRWQDRVCSDTTVPEKEDSAQLSKHPRRHNSFARVEAQSITPSSYCGFC